MKESPAIQRCEAEKMQLPPCLQGLEGCQPKHSKKLHNTLVRNLLPFPKQLYTCIYTLGPLIALPGTLQSIEYSIIQIIR